MPARSTNDRRIAELEARVAELDAFACSVAHDVRAPLRAVHGYARMLEEDHGGDMPDEARACVGKIIRAAKDMERVIEDLFVLSRTGSQPMPATRVRTRELVEQVIADLAPAGSSRVRIHVGELHDCLGHAGLLRQVWTNLLSNALKFTRERDPAVIEIGSTEAGRLVTYFVSDNGAGFDMDGARDLFMPFRRFHDARLYDGHGIGLAIVQRIIRRHSGRIWAQARPGEGANFYFTLSRR